ncbi:unnamed protein product [Symbiodinium natans]|uniref:Uncharacterized protein n=1 Tax=Symbiodinium natans TaxID=878477 RepID=A0A812TEY4_9DINO|nr:unnamed protein product [Symbiodinium natans]CAE7417604.1 unnamed protein product [Symbiodinium natans]CAE7519310.1 unnamed protein product [Symbiodinium natans]
MSLERGNGGHTPPKRQPPATVDFTPPKPPKRRRLQVTWGQFVASLTADYESFLRDQARAPEPWPLLQEQWDAMMRQVLRTNRDPATLGPAPHFMQQGVDEVLVEQDRNTDDSDAETLIMGQQ